MVNGDGKGALLQQAQQALAQANYGDVVRCCKQLLKQDRGNYGAYVLLAQALRRSNHFPQAHAALRRAVDTDASALPAWLALVELHEVTGEVEIVVDACEAVRRLAQATGDKGQYVCYTLRLATTLARAQQHTQALAAWRELLGSLETLSPSMQLEAFCGVADAEAALLDLAMKQDWEQRHVQACNEGLDVRTVEQTWVRTERYKALEAALQRTLQHPGLHFERHHRMLLDHYLWAARATGQREARLQVLQQCVVMISSHNAVSAFEVALTYCEEDGAAELFCETGGVEQLKQGVHAARLWLGMRFVHIHPSHGLALATIASVLHGSLERKRVLCEKALRLDDTCVNGWKLLAEVRAEEGAHNSAAECVRRGLQALTSLRSLYGLHLLYMELRLRFILGHTHLATQGYMEADSIFQYIVEAAQEVSSRQAQTVLTAALEGRVKVAFAQGNVEAAEARLGAVLSVNAQNHWALAEQGWLMFQKGNVDQALVALEQAVVLCGDDSSYRHRLGLVYWELGEQGKEQAVAHLVEAARLDPREADVFRYLGHYYGDIAGDTRRAARCYQKAIMLDSEDEDAGEALCDLLEQGGQLVLEAAVCRDASQHSPRAFWAWRRLGFMQVQGKQWSEAVANLQHALRGYSSDGASWEALGFAYQQLGMFTAALKAYERAVALQKNSPVFALLQSGSILLSLASYTQASDVFRSAVEKAPHHVVAQCGLAAALLGCARECMGVGAFAWGATLLEEASDIASFCTAAHGTVAAAWKLLGDIEVAYAQTLPCETMQAGVEVAGRDGVNLGAAAYLHARVEEWYQQRVSASKRARQAYLRMLHLCPSQGGVYADLAIALELVSSLEQQKTRSSSTRMEAEKAVLAGLHLEGANADLWVMLGIIAQHKALQQHACIQALRVDAYHALTWAHLGKLYLEEGHEELAMQAFDRARSADPMLGLPWAGMALVHSLRSRKEDEEEALASCSYAVHLSPMVEVQLGLAKLAERAHQLQSAQVYAATEQAVQRAPHQAEAHNLRGLACESRGNLSAAITAFQMARHALALSPGSGGSSTVKQNNMVSLNLARVLCKASIPRAAIQEYKQLADSGILLEEHEALRSYAVAVWQAGDRGLAAAVAKQAVKLSKDASALSLYCKMTYWITGPQSALDEICNTPMELFHFANFSLTALALAVASGHQPSVFDVVSRCGLLFKHECGPQANLLLAAGKQIMQGMKQSTPSDVAGSLLKALHSFPNNMSLRAKLGQTLIESSPGGKAKSVMRCCSVHLPPTIEQGALCTSLVAAMVACGACGCVRPSLSFSSCSSHNASASSVVPQLQRWVHTQPWNRKAQYSLVLALQMQAQKSKQLYHTISRIAHTQLATMPEDSHMSLMLRICASDAALHSGDGETALQQAKAACELNVSSGYSFLGGFLLARCYVTTQNHTASRLELEKRHEDGSPDDVLGLLKLAELERQLGFQREERSDTLEDAIQKKNVDEQRMWLALCRLGDAQALLQDADYSSAEKTVAEALALLPDNDVLHLFHGAICMELAKLGGKTDFLSLSIRSLSRAVRRGLAGLPIAGALLALTESSKLNSRGRGLSKWEHSLHVAWAGWPADHRPAELYFQMGLLAEQSKAASPKDKWGLEIFQSTHSWMQRAVHLNPTCPRYWMTLRQQ